MRGFPDWRLGLLTAVCVAAPAMPAFGAAERDEGASDGRMPAQTGPDEGATVPGTPTEGQGDAEAQAAEPGARATLTPIATESIEANANVDLPQDI